MEYRPKKTVFADSPEASGLHVLPLEYAHVSMVRGVRQIETLEQDKIAAIIEAGFDPEKAVALIACWNRRKFAILDGNHRLAAAMASGVEWIPIVRLEGPMLQAFSACGAMMQFAVKRVKDPVRWNKEHRPPNPI